VAETDKKCKYQPYCYPRQSFHTLIPGKGKERRYCRYQINGEILKHEQGIFKDEVQHCLTIGGTPLQAFQIPFVCRASALMGFYEAVNSTFFVPAEVFLIHRATSTD